MEDQIRRELAGGIKQISGEEGTPPDLLVVRTVLRQLPKRECPTGFEFRLQRRIEGTRAQRSSLQTGRGWAWNWAGAGLGIAAALIIGVFAFDLGNEGVERGQLTGTPNTPSVEQGGVAATPTSVTDPTSTERMPAAEDNLVKQETPKDSNAAKTPSQLPENLYHVVGGNSSNK